MDYIRLGSTGLEVSRLVLGCMSFGDPSRGPSVDTEWEDQPAGSDLFHPDDRGIVEAVATIATRRDVPRAQVALAWVASRPVASAPIVGATKPHHISDAVAALDLTLTDDEVQELQSAYAPHHPAGF